jgi:hypothetical protein
LPAWRGRTRGATAIAVRKLGTPGHVGRHCLKAVGITSLAGLGESQREIGRLIISNDFLQQLGDGAEQFS